MNINEYFDSINLRSYRLNVITLDETDSTNSECRRRLVSGCKMPLLVTASSQTGGRGRQGKSFVSPPGGLYMSLLTNPDSPFYNSVRVTAATAVAVSRALEEVCGLDVGIKWVNDIYADGRKLCGILAEAVNNYNLNVTEYLINGIGFNIDSVPPDTNAVSVFELTGIIPDRNALAAQTAYNLLEIYDMIAEGNYSYMDEYRRRSVILGHDINYWHNGEMFTGHAYDIDDTGTLFVRSPDGDEVTLSSGEISVRLK